MRAGCPNPRKPQPCGLPLQRLTLACGSRGGRVQKPRFVRRTGEPLSVLEQGISGEACCRALTAGCSRVPAAGSTAKCEGSAHPRVMSLRMPDRYCVSGSRRGKGEGEGRRREEEGRGCGSGACAQQEGLVTLWGAARLCMSEVGSMDVGSGRKVTAAVKCSGACWAGIRSAPMQVENAQVRQRQNRSCRGRHRACDIHRCSACVLGTVSAASQGNFKQSMLGAFHLCMQLAAVCARRFPQSPSD